MSRFITVFGCALLFLLSTPVLAQTEDGQNTEEQILTNLNANQMGKGSVLALRQVGDSNFSTVNQHGMQEASILQEGMYNSNEITLEGYANQLNARQKGNGNNLILHINGTNNNLRFLQDGNHNYASKYYGQVYNMDMNVEQHGDNNHLSVDLSETVDGSLLPSAIIQKDGGNIEVKTFSDFSAIKPGNQ